MTADPDKRSRRMAEVLRLHLTEGKGIKAIARQLKIHRKTVRKLLGLARRERKDQPVQPRTSILDPYQDEIRRALDDCADIRAPAVLDRLRAKGYQGGITVVRDRLKLLRPRPNEEAFFTRDYGPGQMLQVDWADFGFALPGCARRVSAFVAALPYSRHLYLEFGLSQAMGAFLRCMDRALRFFGGRTTVDVFDGMRTVVKERAANDVVFNPRFLEYAGARGFAARVCPPRRPTSKPYVERPIGFVRTRFWAGRRFSDLFDLNVQATTWRDDIANNRIHDDTGKVPSLVFQNEERRFLEPVPDRCFDTDDLESCGVSKTFRVRFDRNVYSVPWRLIGQTVLWCGPTTSRSASSSGPSAWPCTTAPGTWATPSSTRPTSRACSSRSLAPRWVHCLPSSRAWARPPPRTSRSSPPTAAPCAGRSNGLSCSPSSSATPPRAPRWRR
jgi:transposase